MAPTKITKTIKLADGNRMPVMGFGTYKIGDQETMNTAIDAAWNAGYRMFDTAMLYRNEDILGPAIQQLGLPREGLFLTSKVAEVVQGYDRTMKAVEGSLKRLQTDYLDLLLVHWPVREYFFDTWKAMEQLKADGKVRSIGVSNYTISHLELLATQAKEMPVVNQVEYHPYLNQQALFDYDQEKNIVTEAWSPLGRRAVLDNPMLMKIAKHHQKSVAQIVLRWELQHELVTIPKSTHPDRIKENAEIFDFDLDVDEMTMIDILNRNERTGNEPEIVYETGKQY
ncbi:MAG: aldo/keto reductase [Levilactobacillus sp.]|jgi:diketogulonate reductase-like aldo/keto reductase|uniref:aldo/keto reductase n=1 Tax=Levilactobacillus sp. TaxID=2767919 RepID=UPI00258BB31F|nr:aldo/keto reductase [Levilactobacillus sp.]MCI1552874.1 aldo/keto reductase [Levilactobacillus sp.]MCI1598014.1 aldo/keto reductase [Levilactobacillus sp.]MCI1605930.1 aldo/keto reductase [Levilactobacillus sp.]